MTRPIAELAALPDGAYVSVAEAAALLGVSSDTARRTLRALPAVRLPGRGTAAIVRVRVGDLRALLRGCTAQQRTTPAIARPDLSEFADVLDVGAITERWGDERHD